MDYTVAQIDKMKAWIYDCYEDTENLDDLSTGQIIRFMNKNYMGGAVAFIEDGGY